MSSRLHNKWHRHNHHTNPTNDINLPDSGHDPIASPESPFQGTFALNGELSASQSGQFAGDVALKLISTNLSLSGSGGITAGGTSTFNTLVASQLRVVTPSTNFESEVRHSGRYLEVNIDNRSYFIPLWIPS